MLYKTSKIVFSRFIFTFCDMGIHGNTGLQGVTGGYMGVTRVYRGLQGVTRGDRGEKGLRGVLKGYRNFFLTRTFPDSSCWSIFHKNQN